ncbi:MAG TPA: YheC/YheD family protein [Firmicutes bacterium]|nr:YheC/YheD family protein [Bacillota bacterium]
MKTKPVIGVLAFSPAPLEQDEFLQEMEHEIVVFTPWSIKWSEKKVNGLLYRNGSWIRGIFPFPAVVYNRCYTSDGRYVRWVAKFIGKSNVFNCMTRFNKWEVYQLLAQTKVKPYLPETWQYRQELLPVLLERHRHLVLKPALGHYGENVYRLEKTATGEYHIYDGSVWPLHSSLNAEKLMSFLQEETGEKRFLLQQFIPFAEVNRRLFEVRLFVQKNGLGQWAVTAAVSRIAAYGFWVTNFSPTVRPAEAVLAEAGFAAKLAEIKAAGMKTAAILESQLGPLGEISVDCGIAADGKVWIIEVNGMPVKSGPAGAGDPELEKRVYLPPFQYAAFLLQKKR